MNRVTEKDTAPETKTLIDFSIVFVLTVINDWFGILVSNLDLYVI